MDSGFEDHPVVGVTWYGANAFCEWRGASLPTEAEWEKAARGEVDGAVSLGDDLPTCQLGAKNGAQFEPCDGETVPVGSFGSNDFGLYDMSGNVWEWVRDWYLEDYYSQSPDKNPSGPDKGQYHVHRGGSWYLDNKIRVAFRAREEPGEFFNNLGFRCARDLATHITDEKGVDMAMVPAGEFLMGSNNGEPDEMPIHSVYISDFYIDIYEVTNELYKLCVKAETCTPPGEKHSTIRENYYSDSDYDQYPMIRATWEQAQDFCKWRDAKLPTEAQWEKAAARRGLEGKRYPWGDEQPTCDEGAKNGAHFINCLTKDTIQVGTFAPNNYGLYDMTGNVWEWIYDWYSDNYYLNATANNPTGPDTGTYHVARGGAFENAGGNLRVANRSKDNLTDMPKTIGFRCARSASNFPADSTPSPLVTETVTWKQGKLAYVLKNDLGTSLNLLDLTSEYLPVQIFEDSGRISAPAWSPDGVNITFHLLGGDLFMIKAAPGPNPEWRSSSCTGASWSPDGKQLICSSSDNYYSILSSSSGTEINRVLTPYTLYTLFWSPGMDEFAYAFKGHVLKPVLNVCK